MSKNETLSSFEQCFDEVCKRWNKDFLLQLDCKVIGFSGLLEKLDRDGLYLLFRKWLHAENTQNSLLSLTGSQVFHVRGHRVKFMAR